MSDPTNDPYDLTPYPDVIVKTTFPSHVGAVGLLLGADPPLPRRIVEFGCGTGANTLAIAQEWPTAEVIGVDRSARQIAMAQKAATGVANLRFIQADLMFPEMETLAGSQGIDYLVCHGVYSWVPAAVQDRIMQLTSKMLSARGLAFISFNVLPGWHAKLPIREMLLFHTAGFDTPGEKMEQARMCLELLESGVAERELPVGMLTRELAEMILAAPPQYLLHELLSECNEPLLFMTFAERLTRAGLKYVGDADFGTNVPADVSDVTKKTLMEIAGSRERYEQYLDFMLHRTFRRAIVTRGDVEVTGKFTSKALGRMRFRGKEGATVEGGGPAWEALAALRPQWTTVEQIAQRAGMTELMKTVEVVGKILTGVAEGWVEARMVV